MLFLPILKQIFSHLIHSVHRRHGRSIQSRNLFKENLDLLQINHIPIINYIFSFF
jgi:hypothetical protein